MHQYLARVVRVGPRTDRLAEYLLWISGLTKCLTMLVIVSGYVKSQ